MNDQAQDNFAVRVKHELLVHPRISTISSLARRVGFHRNTVSRAIHHGTMPRVRKAVARALSIPIS